jgi:hypothetical protein
VRRRTRDANSKRRIDTERATATNNAWRVTVVRTDHRPVRARCCRLAS